MVDVRATNEKLVERCHRIVMEATGCDHETAHKALTETNNNVKEAIVMILLNVSAEEAKTRLSQVDGNIRSALE